MTFLRTFQITILGNKMIQFRILRRNNVPFLSRKQIAED